MTSVDLFRERGITRKTLDKYGVTWTDYKITIPLQTYGGVTYNKYRVLNGDTKYYHDKGAGNWMYGFGEFHDKDDVIICEGELDCLALVSRGFNATTNTTGAASFDGRWSWAFKDKNVYICYDNDEAGRLGALKVQAVIPHAKIIWLEKYVNSKGDVGDFFKKYSTGHFKLLMRDAQSYTMPVSIKDRRVVERELGRLRQELHEARMNHQPYKHIRGIMSSYLDALKVMDRKAKRRKTVAETDDLDNAKGVSVENYLDFNEVLMVECIWHDDKTPSMKYYPDTNSVYCFGCSRSGDVVDVVAQLENLDFKGAVKKLLSD